MKILKYIALITFTGIGTHSFAQFTSKDFKKFKNLKGIWEAPIEKGFVQEKWERVNDSTVTGEFYKIEKGVSILDEKMKILLSAGGEITYGSTIHYLNKGLPVIFTLVKKEDDKFIFEYKDASFTQQIIYEWKSSDKMDKTVNRYINGKEAQGPKANTYKFVKK